MPALEPTPAYVLDCYFGCGTKANKIAYALLALFFCTSFALLVPSGLFLSACDQVADDCLMPCHVFCSASTLTQSIGDMAATSPSGALNSVALGQNEDNVADLGGWQAFVQTHAGQTGTLGLLNTANRYNLQRFITWLGSSGYCLSGDAHDFADLTGVDLLDLWDGNFYGQDAGTTFITQGNTFVDTTLYNHIPESPRTCNWQNQGKFVGLQTNHNTYTTSRSCCKDCELVYNDCIGMNGDMFIIGWLFFVLFHIPLVFMCFCSPNPNGSGISQTKVGSTTAPMA